MFKTNHACCEEKEEKKTILHVGSVLLGVPHPLIVLCRGEDLSLANEDVTKRSAATALLVKAGYRIHRDSFDYQRFGVGQCGLL